MTVRTAVSTAALLLLPSTCCYGFNSHHIPSSTFFKSSPSSTSSITSSSNGNSYLTMVHHSLDADMMERWAGGERYEMVPLPDSMVDQTVFVGNLCEFVQDDDLSEMFQRVSHLLSVPACVARRANRDSLQYGFVAFPTVEEKEAAILRFHGVEFMGRKLRVEEIRDDPRKGRVKVPEKIVSYVLGAAKTISRKKKKNGSRLEGGLRRIAPRSAVLGGREGSNTGMRKKQQQRRTAMPSKASITHVQLVSKLNDRDKEEFLRATRRGFVSLNVGTGRTRSRTISKSRLVRAHRQWCDERGQPQIVHCKSFSRAGPKQCIDSDCIIVDLSPLRMTSAVMGAEYDADDFLVRWKAQVVTAASTAGMELKALLDDDDDYWMGHTEDTDDEDDDPIVVDYEGGVDDECNVYFDSDEECDSEEDYDLDEVENDEEEENVVESTVTTNEESTRFIVEMSEEDLWANQPISSFPVVSMGEFEGQRANAKAMARELAVLWQLLPEEEYEQEEDDDDSLETSRPHSAYSRGGDVKQSTNFASARPGRGGGGSRTKKDRKTESRRRRRNNNSRNMDLFLF